MSVRPKPVATATAASAQPKRRPTLDEVLAAGLKLQTQPTDVLPSAPAVSGPNLVRFEPLVRPDMIPGQWLDELLPKYFKDPVCEQDFFSRYNLIVTDGKSVDEYGNELTFRSWDGCMALKEVRVVAAQAPFKGTIRFSGPAGEEKPTQWLSDDEQSYVVYDDTGIGFASARFGAAALKMLMRRGYTPSWRWNEVFDPAKKSTPPPVDMLPEVKTKLDSLVSLVPRLKSFDNKMDVNVEFETDKFPSAGGALVPWIKVTVDWDQKNWSEETKKRAKKYPLLYGKPGGMFIVTTQRTPQKYRDAVSSLSNVGGYLEMATGGKIKIWFGPEGETIVYKEYTLHPAITIEKWGPLPPHVTAVDEKHLLVRYDLVGDTFQTFNNGGVDRSYFDFNDFVPPQTEQERARDGQKAERGLFGELVGILAGFMGLGFVHKKLGTQEVQDKFPPGTMGTLAFLSLGFANFLTPVLGAYVGRKMGQDSVP
tara:strand:- start:100 stop:1539 length:1440 start_codon:yes stop_codon:yes gene_type:complete